MRSPNAFWQTSMSSKPCSVWPIELPYGHGMCIFCRTRTHAEATISRDLIDLTASPWASVLSRFDRPHTQWATLLQPAAPRPLTLPLSYWGRSSGIPMMSLIVSSQLRIACLLHLRPFLTSGGVRTNACSISKSADSNPLRHEFSSPLLCKSTSSWSTHWLLWTPSRCSWKEKPFI